MRLRQLAFSFAILSTSVLAAQTEQPAQSVVLSSEGDGPVVLYDDEIISQEDLAQLSSDMIGDIQILSGAEADKRFGKYATHGAIVVSSPSKASTVTETVQPVAVPSEHRMQGAEVKISVDAGDDAHVIIDGQVTDMAALRAIDPLTIDQVQVHKGQQAIDLFGDKARGGAVVVTTKEQK